MAEIVDDEHACANCGKSSQSKSNLTNQKFWVNVDMHCKHYFCERCKQQKGHLTQFKCPKCARMVIVSKMVQKDLDEIEVERDFAIRKKIKAIYNKSCDDFESADDFRDYEEVVEDIIFNLVNEMEVEETNKKVAAYQQSHLQEIAEKQSKMKVEHDLMREDIIHAEEMRQQKDSEDWENRQAEQVRKREHAKQMNEVALGERDELTVTGTAAGRVNISGRDASALAQSGTRLMAGAMGGMDAAPLQLNQPHAPSHVATVLNSRPEPKHLKLTDRRRCDTYSSETVRHMHAAGGFDVTYMAYTRRNWRTITGEIALMLSKHQGVEMDVDGEEGRKRAGFAWPLNWE